MRDTLLLYVNGKRLEVRGETAFASLSDFLRGDLQLTGTKVVCAEGDCGACTVLVGRPELGRLKYETVDACIQFLYQLDCRHIVTVEGLTPRGDRGQPERTLHPIQTAMVECHGSQCGFCTPGFVMALAGRCEQDASDLRTSLTGNLCRCTGYTAILDAAASLDAESPPKVESLYPSAPIARDFFEHGSEAIRIETQAPKPTIFFRPQSLADAVAFKASHPHAVIVAGGTELGVLRNKRGLEPAAILSLAGIPGLGEITQTEDATGIGANVTWTQVEAYAKAAWPEFYKIVVRFGSPQIRNVATMVANIAHGSPIADSLPFLLVAEAEIDIVGRAGSRRVNLNGFYKGYKIKDLTPDEIIAHVRVPKIADDEILKLYKVSRRNDLDIATFGAAIRVTKFGDIISRAYLAYSGVAAMALRLPKTEGYLRGKPFSEATFAAAGRIAKSEIDPISDVRGSRDFRWQLAERILMKFYFECAEPQLVQGAVP